MYYEIRSMREEYNFSQKGTIIFDHESKQFRVREWCK